MVQVCLYSMLGCNPAATPEALKKAYKKQAMVHHPYKGGNAHFFNRLKQVLDILLDKHLREIYDSCGHDGLDDYEDAKEKLDLCNTQYADIEKEKSHLCNKQYADIKSDLVWVEMAPVQPMDLGDEVKFDMASGKNYIARKRMLLWPRQAAEPPLRTSQAPPRPSQASRPWPRVSVGKVFNEHCKREKIDQGKGQRMRRRMR